MSGDVIVGIIILAGALASLTCLVLWSRRRINRIARRRYGSARAIEKELNGGG